MCFVVFFSAVEPLVYQYFLGLSTQKTHPVADSYKLFHIRLTFDFFLPNFKNIFLFRFILKKIAIFLFM